MNKPTARITFHRTAISSARSVLALILVACSNQDQDPNTPANGPTIFCDPETKCPPQAKWLKTDLLKSRFVKIGFDQNRNIILADEIVTRPADTQGMNGQVGIQLIKFDEAGNELWRKVALEGVSAYAGLSMETKPDGNIVLFGYAKDDVSLGSVPVPSSPVVYLAEFDSNGELVWGKIFAGGFCSLGGINLDSSGGILITGSYRMVDWSGGIEALVRERDSVVSMVKLTPRGDLLWQKKTSGLPPDPQSRAAASFGFSSVHYTPEGTILTTGRHFADVDFGGGMTVAGTGSFIAEFASNGTPISIATSTRASELRLVVDDEGARWLYGKVNPPWDHVNLFGLEVTPPAGRELAAFLAKLDSNHRPTAVTWVDAADRGIAFAVSDRRGGVAVMGYYNGSAIITDHNFMSETPTSFLASIDSEMKHRWSWHFGSRQLPIFENMATDPMNGDIVLFGIASGPVDLGSDVFGKIGGNIEFLVRFAIP